MNVSSLIQSFNTHITPTLSKISSAISETVHQVSKPLPALMGDLKKLVQNHSTLNKDQMTAQSIANAQRQHFLSKNPGIQEVSDGKRTLSRGTQPSKENGLLQDLLRARGYSIEDQHGGQRGFFGSKTEMAVKKFQSDHGLIADGIVGQKTLSALLDPASPKVNALPSKKSLSAQEFINRYSVHAVESQKITGIPASVTLAQAALESNWGKSAPGNNFFGIKGAGPAGTQSLKTWEVIDGKKVTVSANFRKYNSAVESFIDHGKVIAHSKYLKHAMEHTGSPLEFISALQSGKSKYATDPKYTDKIMSIIHQHHLDQYDLMARANLQ